MAISKIKIRTNRLWIRTIETTDSEKLHEFVRVNHNDLIHAAPITVASTKTIKSTYDFIKGLETDRAKGLSLWNLIYCKSNENLIGYISIVKVGFYGKISELGYAISKDQAGLGYATEALNNIVEYCFNKLNMYYLLLRIYDQNIGSMKVAKKSGFLIKNESSSTMQSSNGDVLNMIHFWLERHS